MALYLFSDAHLGADDEAKETEKRARLSALFDMVEAEADRLVILGDLFDFWFEYKYAIPKGHQWVLCRLSGLVERGIKVDYVSGNHDFWMGDFFETEIGVRLHRDKLDLTYDGLRMHLVHGDGLAPSDRGYRLLKRILRNRFCFRLYRKLPPDWAIPFAKWVSGSSRSYTSGRDPSFVEEYEQYARGMLDGDYDLVVIGHLHIASEKQFPGGRYINSGDFINGFSYVKIADGKAELLRVAR